MAWDITLCNETPQHQAEIVLAKFAVSDTKSSIKFTLGGLAVKPLCRNISEDAFTYLKEHMPHLIEKDGVIYGCYDSNLRIEHVIPTEIVYRHLEKMAENETLTEEYVENLIKNRLICAIITKEEDDCLTDAHLRSSMTVNGEWDFDHGDVFARYNTVGIQMHAW